MEILLLTVGKTSTSYIEAGIGEYIRRLTHYLPFRMLCLPDIKNTRKLTVGQQKEAEGKSILAEIKPGDLVVLLDEKGKEPTSMEYAKEIERLLGSGRKRVIFIIGGAYGFSEAVYERADRKMALSKMTFSHEMVRLFFVEQTYRAMTILNNEPYHHE